MSGPVFPPSEHGKFPSWSRTTTWQARCGRRECREHSVLVVERRDICDEIGRPDCAHPRVSLPMRSYLAVKSTMATAGLPLLSEGFPEVVIIRKWAYDVANSPARDSNKSTAWEKDMPCTWTRKSMALPDASASLQTQKWSLARTCGPRLCCRLLCHGFCPA